MNTFLFKSVHIFKKWFQFYRKVITVFIYNRKFHECIHCRKNWIHIFMFLGISAFILFSHKNSSTYLSFHWSFKNDVMLTSLFLFIIPYFFFLFLITTSHFCFVFTSIIQSTTLFSLYIRQSFFLPLFYLNAVCFFFYIYSNIFFLSFFLSFSYTHVYPNKYRAREEKQ